MPKHTQKLKKIITELLIKSQWNRNSDYALYADYIKEMLPEVHCTQYYTVMKNYKEYGIFSFKAVERTRRAIQREAKLNGDMSLLSDAQVEKWRKENEQKYREEFTKGSE